MSIPESVKRQAEEADRLLEQLSAQQPPQTGEPEEPEEPAEPPTPKEPVEEPPAPTPPARNEDEAALWKQRYDTLRGKYDAEVGRVAQQNKELQTQIQQLTSKMEELLKPRQPEPEPTPPTPLVRPEDVENFGDDMIDLIRRVSQDTVTKREAELNKVIKELREENARLKESLVGVQQRQGQTEQERFITKLAQLVPDWETVNQDPAFLLWLGQVDPLTGQQRQILLNAAAADMDPQRVAAFFNAFKGGSKQVEPPPTPPPPANSPPPARSPAPPEVARQVQPGRSKSASTPAAPDSATRIWSEKEIKAFYQDVALGRYRDHEDLRARTEAEIDLAVAQGRVRP